MKIRLIHTLSFWLTGILILAVVSFSALLMWNLSSGFSGYLAQKDIDQFNRLIPFTERLLEDVYATKPTNWEPHTVQMILEEFKVDQDRQPSFNNFNTDEAQVQHRPAVSQNNDNNKRPPPPRDAFDQRIEIFILNEENEWQELHFGPAKNRSSDKKIIQSQLVKWHGQTIAKFNLIEPPPVRGGTELDFLKKQFQSIILVACLLVVICFFIAWYIAKRFAQPLSEIQNATQNIANGQFQIKLKVNRSDEIGDVMHNINLMSQSLQELEQTRRTWLAEISHELRTPLSVLQGEIEALEDGVRLFNQHSLKSLKEETLGLTRLVADLHLLALSDLNSLPCYFEEVNVLQLFQTNMNKLQVQAKEKKLNCQIQLDINEQLYAYWDSQRIHQVLQNICRNAVFYTDSPGQISVHLFQKNNSIICKIQDSAPSVDLADIHRLFEPLFRSDVSRNKNSGGSGLGLAIVKAIISAHKGKISARPSIIGGLLIEFELPITHGNN